MNKLGCMMNQGDLTNEQWEQLTLLLPRQKPARGRPAADHRRVLNGILWDLRTGDALAGPAGALRGLADGRESLLPLAEGRCVGSAVRRRAATGRSRRRDRLVARQTFFNDLHVLTRYLFFANWPLASIHGYAIGTRHQLAPHRG